MILFTENPLLTEVSFFKREFGLIVETVESILDFERRINSIDSSVVLVASTNPEHWIESLNKLKKNSVIFFLLGNETYDPYAFNTLNNITTLKHAFVYNSPNKISNMAIMGGIIGNIYDGGLRKTNLHGSVYRDGRISYSLKGKFKKINMKYPFTNFPQGYSNSFANKISKLAGIGESDSLISADTLKKISSLKNIVFNFSFVGQVGTRRRETFLRTAKQFKEAKILPPERGFGGNNLDHDYTYVKLLLNSRFILVPPGNYNNFNHRYTESLICHSLPAILANNSIDPSLNDHWTRNFSFLKRYSIKAQMKYLGSFDSAIFEEHYKAASFIDFKEILETKSILSAHISS